MDEGADGQSGHRASVLVVEDELGIVDFVRRGLEAEGFSVTVATDGIAGERAALGGGFDAVVLDLMLPGRSGLEILAALREARPRLPVIVLTARGEVEDRVAGLDGGAADYIVKPFSLAELVARVRAQLRVAAQTSVTTLRGAGIEANLLTRTVLRDGVPVPSRGRSSSCSHTCCATAGRFSRASRSSARCGAMSTIRRPTWWTSTSATCGASSADPMRPRRSSPCARSATG